MIFKTAFGSAGVYGIITFHGDDFVLVLEADSMVRSGWQGRRFRWLYWIEDAHVTSPPSLATEPFAETNKRLCYLHLSFSSSFLNEIALLFSSPAPPASQPQSLRVQKAPHLATTNAFPAR